MSADKKFDNSSPLGGLLFLFHKNHHKYINDSLEEYGLNINQALFILKIRYAEEDLCQEDLAEFFYLSKGYVAKSIKDLEDKGIILRERLDDDKRKYSLSLSSKGEEILPIIHKTNKDWEMKMGLSELDDNFMETIRDLTFKAISLNE